jgi:hypothetical protein
MGGLLVRLSLFFLSKNTPYKNMSLDDNINIELGDTRSSLLFTPFKKVKFIDKNFDLIIDPKHFLKWLEAEGEDVVNDDYKQSVSSMCEYSCLYLAMLFHDKELKGTLRIYNGNFGFWSHFWMGYTFEGVEYFIDLTLMQFVDSAPKLAISLADNDRTGYCYEEEYIQDIYQYVQEKRAFQFYKNPNEIN